MSSSCLILALVRTNTCISKSKLSLKIRYFISHSSSISIKKMVLNNSTYIDRSKQFLEKICERERGACVKTNGSEKLKEKTNDIGKIIS